MTLLITEKESNQITLQTNMYKHDYEKKNKMLSNFLLFKFVGILEIFNCLSISLISLTRNANASTLINSTQVISPSCL